MPGTLTVLHLTQPQLLLVSKARSYGDYSSWHWNPGLGNPVWGWDPSLLREGPLQLGYPFRFLATTHEWGTSPFCISAPFTSLDMASSIYLWLGLLFL